MPVILPLIFAIVCGVGGCAQGGGGGGDDDSGDSAEGESIFDGLDDLFPDSGGTTTPSTGTGTNGDADSGLFPTTASIERGFGSCATQNPNDSELAELSNQFSSFLQNRASRVTSSAVARTDAVIPVYFHVIRKGLSYDEGNVPDSQLIEQVEVLNRWYSGAGGGIATPFRFALGGIDKVDKPEWFDMNPGSQAELDAKLALHTGGPDALNIYTANLDNKVLGYATFPLFLFLLQDIDGIVLMFKSLPGGSFERYNTGRVAVHETGHWLGLLHTFQGECDGLFGDLVQDTPSEKLPMRGEFCPASRDSCSQTGVDPVHNHMTYTDDSCRTEFTPGQLELMLFNATFYRGLSL